jgi:uncharacterized membrane protein
MEVTLKRVEETVIVAATVRVAYELWTQFEPMPAYLSGANGSSGFGGEGRSVPGELSIAWRSLAGEPQSGAIIFTPLDAESTRILARIEWVAETTPESADSDRSSIGAEVRETLRHYAEFIESQ